MYLVAARLGRSKLLLGQGLWRMQLCSYREEISGLSALSGSGAEGFFCLTWKLLKYQATLQR